MGKKQKGGSGNKLNTNPTNFFTVIILPNQIILTPNNNIHLNNKNITGNKPNTGGEGQNVPAKK